MATASKDEDELQGAGARTRPLRSHTTNVYAKLYGLDVDDGGGVDPVHVGGTKSKDAVKKVLHQI